MQEYFLESSMTESVEGKSPLTCPSFIFSCFILKRVCGITGHAMAMSYRPLKHADWGKLWSCGWPDLTQHCNGPRAFLHCCLLLSLLAYLSQEAVGGEEMQHTCLDCPQDPEGQMQKAEEGICLTDILGPELLCTFVVNKCLSKSSDFSFLFEPCC